MPNSISILSTGELDNVLLQQAFRQGIKLDCIPFIETKTIDSPALNKAITELEKENATIVFTSQHAVESVSKSLNRKPPSLKIYCLDGSTTEHVATTFGKESIMGTAPDATSL